jgi:hypothetical protein
LHWSSQGKGNTGEAFEWLWLTLKSGGIVIKVDWGADFLVIRYPPCDWYFVEVKTGQSARLSEFQNRTRAWVGKGHYYVAHKDPIFYQAEWLGHEIINTLEKHANFGNPGIGPIIAGPELLRRYGLEIC